MIVAGYPNDGCLYAREAQDSETVRPTKLETTSVPTECWKPSLEDYWGATGRQFTSEGRWSCTLELERKNSSRNMVDTLTSRRRLQFPPQLPVTLLESVSRTLREDLSPLVIRTCHILTVFLKGNVSVRIPEPVKLIMKINHQTHATKCSEWLWTQ